MSLPPRLVRKMPRSEADYGKCRNIARILLADQPMPTRNTIEAAVAQAIGACGVAIDADALVRELQSLFSVWVGGWKALDDPTGHHVWLPDRKSSIDWRFWRRYETYLREQLVWSPAVLDETDELTDAVLSRLEDPERQAPWDRRGMVVGSVQSGKTSNYLGLICKALDAGYKLVIILAGMHKSLRSQTQLRVDEGVLGFDTQKSRMFNQDNQRIGVGLVPSEPLYVHSLTNSADNGDFKRSVAASVGVRIGGDPVILVVKKNKLVLNNLLEWALSVEGQADSPGGQRVIRNVPLLLIDDEADNASINTKAIPVGPDGGQPEDYDVTAINEKVRSILRGFEKAAYVGYTATPFANIFVNPDCATQRLGDDVFPRSFIINLSSPSDYTGPVRVFGVDGDPDAGVEDSDPLPLVRLVDDHEESFPPKHKPDHIPERLPESLVQAMHAFILVCAARRARGQTTAHNSMLVHVTRYVNVQGMVADLVSRELASIRRRIEYGDGDSPDHIRTALRQLWEQDFLPTTRAVGELTGQDAPVLEWKEIDRRLVEAVSPIGLKIINGTAGDVLDYYEHPSGRSVIAIGGDKLSRGLTLEGLSVSYFLRHARMYDTLLQMGRWFGYRPHYLDLCRLYTTDELVEWYRHITLAEQELRREFDYMVESRQTPEDYGLRVRTHPDGLLITAVNKMREGAVMRLSYSGELAETAHFSTSPNAIEANFRLCDQLVTSLGAPPGRVRGNFLWTGVSPETITDRFLAGYQAHPTSHRARPERLVDYIRAQAKIGELCDWTVALISVGTAGRTARIGGCDVGLTIRQAASHRAGVYSLKKSHILSPSDQYLDFTQEERELALRETTRRYEAGDIRGKAPTEPNGRVVREVRPPSRGLLIIYPLDPEVLGEGAGGTPIMGFAISFPRSEHAREVEYRVNKVHLDREYDEDGYWTDLG